MRLVIAITHVLHIWMRLRLQSFSACWQYCHPVVDQGPKTCEAADWIQNFARTEYLPNVHCLPRSLALTRFLRLRGHNAVTRLGVSHDKPRRSHAWVEVDGHVVGEVHPPSATFKPLPPPTL